MNTAARLSVAAIVPVYNQRETVCEAIDSILAQTRAVEEIVVVDDGSTDGSGDLVAERYGRKVRLVRQENRGAGGARNTAIQSSHAELLAFLDADDRWMPERVERQAAFMEAHPQCMLSFTAHITHNENTQETREENTRIAKNGYLAHDFFRERALPACAGVMVRRLVFDTVGLFDESLRKCQDTDMWLRIMIRYGFEHIPEPLVWIRRGSRRTEPDLSKWFVWHDRYFAKHRHTFGRGLRGQAIWRAGYASVLRRNAIWCLRHGKGREALAKLLKAVCLWPFFNPSWVMKSGLEFLLGKRVYLHFARVYRTLAVKAKAESAPNRSY